MSNTNAQALATAGRAGTPAYYGGTITVKGRDLITSLMAGETIEFTRIVVGSGRMPEGVHPIDMTDLVSPVAEAVSTVPILEDGELSLVVEYRNDLNGGLKEGFWLTEFAIFAKTANTPEICLYYATLGDSPQPVNAYKDDRVDIRRYPVTIALELDANVEVSYNLGSFMTAEEARELIDAMVGDGLAKASSTKILDITIPSEGWNWEENLGEEPEMGYEEDYNLYLDLPVDGVTDAQVPVVALYKGSLGIAKEAGLCPSVQSFTGYIRFWAMSEPRQEMKATLTLFTEGATGGGGVGQGGGGRYVLPVATATQLGGVKIGDGIKVTKDGVISAEAEVSPEQIASADDAGEMLDEIFGTAPEIQPEE